MHLLYGFRDTLEEIGRRRAEAREFGAEFQFAEVEFDVGKIHEAMVDEKTLATLQFVNVRRMTAATQRLIMNRFREYSGNDMKSIQEIAKHPNLYERLLEEEPFNNLGIIVHPVLDGDLMRQVAYVHPRATPKSFSQSAQRLLQIRLPDWISSKIP